MPMNWYARSTSGSVPDFCSEQPTTCPALFAEFESGRDRLTQAYLASLGENSVVARVDAALFALALISSFERRFLENR